MRNKIIDLSCRNAASVFDNGLELYIYEDLYMLDAYGCMKENNDGENCYE